MIPMIKRSSSSNFSSVIVSHTVETFGAGGLQPGERGVSAVAFGKPAGEGAASNSIVEARLNLPGLQLLLLVVAREKRR
jgi:hypothetical protein